MFAKLWNDEAGIVSLEYLFLATIVGLGLVVGFSNLATALNAEYTELAQAIVALNQSYSYAAASGCAGSHGGVNATDTVGTVVYGVGTYGPAVTSTAVISATACP